MRNILLPLSILCIIHFTSCGQSKLSLQETFFNLLNNYNKDSLEFITSSNFQLKQDSQTEPTTKKEFIDSFVTFSKAINGKFNILSILSDREPKIFLVEDISYYSTYLNLKKLTWKMTIEVKDNKIEKMSADTTKGFQEYMDDFMAKHNSFIEWLKIKYPNEKEDDYRYSEGNVFKERLSEYSTQKNNL